MTLHASCRPFPRAFLVAAAIGLALALGALSISSPIDFRPYFAGLPPALASIVVTGLGILALRRLQAQHGICVVAAGRESSRIGIAIVAALPFMVSVAIAASWLELPPGNAVTGPAALIFYPSMGIIALLALHIVPLTIVLAAGQRLAPDLSTGLRMVASILCVSVLEASLQSTVWLQSAADPPATIAFIAIHLFAFGTVELILLWRFDLVCALGFRLAYYAFWHIAWGYLPH